MKTKPSTKKCPICGKGILNAITGDFRTHFEDDAGAQRELVVPAITYEKCDACGEEILAQDASSKISEAQRAAMGLLSAHEIRGIRQSLGRTQHQMSDLLGIGEKTYCRWESGTHFQSEAFDRYLRLLIADPGTVRLLERIANSKQTDRETLAGTSPFTYLGDVKVSESSSIRFNQIFLNGPFFRA